MLTASSMATFCSLVKHNWNKVWHDSFGHMMLLTPMQASYNTYGIVNRTILVRLLALASASFDANVIVNSTIIFTRSRWLKKCIIYLFSLVMPWCWCWCHMMPTVSINDTIPFVRSRLWKGDATWQFAHLMPLASSSMMPMVSSMATLHFFGQNNQSEVQHNSWLCNAIDGGVSVTSCQECHQWYNSTC